MSRNCAICKNCASCSYRRELEESIENLRVDGQRVCDTEIVDRLEGILARVCREFERRN